MIAVLGAGAVGGLVAALLAHAGVAVHVIARAHTARAIERRGITVRSVEFGDFTAYPPALTRLESDGDALILATKANDLDDALRRIGGEPALVLPLLNGLDHMDALRARFGSRVSAGVIYVETDRSALGTITHSSPFLRVELARPDPGCDERLRALRDDLQLAGIEVASPRSEGQILWAKLVRLNALALTTSASGLLLGEIRRDRAWRDRLEGALVEAVEVARAEGVTIHPSHAIDDLDRFHAELGSSMARDIATGREPELDAIAGAVQRRARAHGVPIPTIDALVAEVVDRTHEAPPRLR